MAEPEAYFAALLPDQTLSARIMHAKAKVRAIAGPQLYVDDPPHVTAYLGAYRSDADARDAFLSIADASPPFDVHTTGWHVFQGDVLTGNNTLVTAVADETADLLRQIQDRIIRAMSPFRDPVACERRYRDSWNSLTPERQLAVRNIGFPFVGGDWQPHITVASVRPADWPLVWEALRHEPILGSHRCDALVLYRLQGREPVEVLRAQS